MAADKVRDYVNDDVSCRLRPTAIAAVLEREGEEAYAKDAANPYREHFSGLLSSRDQRYVGNRLVR